MLQLIARRILETIPVLVLVATITFFMMKAVPGGPLVFVLLALNGPLRYHPPPGASPSPSGSVPTCCSSTSRSRTSTRWPAASS